MTGRWNEPTRGYPPPELRTRDVAWRYGLACLPLLVSVTFSIVPVDEATASVVPVWQRVADLVLGILAIFIIRGRRRYPVATAAILAVIGGFSAAAFGFWWWGAISMATARRWRWVWIVGGVEVAATTIGWLVSDRYSVVRVTQVGNVDEVLTPESFALALFVNLLIYVALVAIGFYIGARRDLVASLTERAATAEREQAMRVAQAEADERARIAREMHDVLAHRISLMSMHAGVLAYRDDLTPEQSREIAGVIQASAHASLEELRTVLGSLRQDEGGAARPQPTLSDLPTLIDEIRAQGSSVILEDTLDTSVALPATIGRHAYRIVQESLTNARKHAVAAPVRIAISGNPAEGVSLVVSNPLTADAGLPGSGLGLVGLRERAQMTGGRLVAGVDNGRFVVRAWLPWQT